MKNLNKLAYRHILNIEDRLDRFHRFKSWLYYRSLHRLMRWNLYQPAPWVGVDDGQRSKATYERWAVIQSELQYINPGSAMDLGSQLGFFSLKLAELNFLTLGVEANKHIFHAARLLRAASGIEGVSFRHLTLDEQTVDLLPNVDVTVFLSLWHHICRIRGVNCAKLVMEKIMQRTRTVCFFETGQSNENYMSWAKQIPDMGSNEAEWISTFLLTCGAHHVKHLGAFPAFSGNVRRHLFAAYKNKVE